MRTLLALALGVLLATTISGCRSSDPCAPCAPCAPAPAACDPCAAWAEPVYGGSCGGDPGIGREGTGAFAR